MHSQCSHSPNHIYDVEYEILDKRSSQICPRWRNSEITDIVVRFKNRATLGKLTFIKINLYSKEMLTQVSNQLKTKKSFQWQRVTYENTTGAKLLEDNPKGGKPLPEKVANPFEETEELKPNNNAQMKSPPKEIAGKSPVKMTASIDGKVDPPKNQVVHPFAVSGSLQTKSELNANNYLLSDKRGVGLFSSPPCWLSLHAWKPTSCLWKIRHLKRNSKESPRKRFSQGSKDNQVVSWNV